MAVRFPSYLHRNRCGIYGFRFVVSRDLRDAFPYRERRLSLLTPVLGRAKVVAYSLALYARHRLALVRAMDDDDQARASAESFLSDLVIERDRIQCRFGHVSLRKAALGEHMAAVGERLRQLLVAQANPGSGLSAQIALPIETLQLIGRADGDDPLTHFELAVDAVLAEIQGLEVTGSDCDRELAQLAGESAAVRKSLEHHIAIREGRALHDAEKRTLAAFTAMIVTEGAGRLAGTASLMSQSALRQVQGLDVEAGQMSVTELFVAYCESHRAEWKNWPDRVKRDYGPVRDAFIKLNGDMRIEDLTVSHSRVFVESLKADAIRRGSRLTTVEKKVSFLRAVFAWAEEQTMLSGLTGPLRISADAESYEAFSLDELKTMFEGIAYRNNAFGRSSRFWLPLLGLYTGGRLEELASSKLDQIIEIDGAWAIELSPGGKKTGKNDFSRRTVPLHRALVNAGLLKYVETLRQEGHIDLFPCTPTATRDGRGKAATRDFQVFRQSLGIGAVIGAGRGTKVFHSFRATVVTAMQEAGVAQETREALTGHARVGVHARTYSQGKLPIKSLIEAINAVSFAFEHPEWADTPGYRYARLRGRASSSPSMPP